MSDVEWEIECPRCGQVLAECSCPREDEDLEGEAEPTDRFGERGEHMSAWRYYDVVVID